MKRISAIVAGIAGVSAAASPLFVFGTAAAAQGQATPAVSASAATEAPLLLPKSSLSTAKTVQAKALFSVMNKDGKPQPFFAVGITVDGPNRYRIDAMPLAAKTKKPSFFFTDGVKQYEFNSVVSEAGVYKIAEAPKPGQRPLSQLYAMAGVELLRTPDAPVRPGITRTIAEGTLGGVKTVLVMDSEPARKTSDGKASVSWTKVWHSVVTGLPLRKLEGYSVDGVERPGLQLDFTDWTFDKPVARTAFVWSVPAGAKSNEEPTLLPVGTVAPDFTAYTPDGTPVKLSDLKGKVVVLDFWATWCGPCQRSMPHLEKVFAQVKDKNVAVLAVCVWDVKAEYDKWVAAKKGTYSFPTVFDPAGRDPKNIAGGLYKVTGIPTQYIIDKNGKIAASTVGYEEGNPFLETALARLGVGPTKQTASAR